MNKTQILAGKKAWRDRHKKERREYQRKYRRQNPELFAGYGASEKTRATQKEYYRKNKKGEQARHLLNQALAKREVERKPCCLCGEDRTIAHHPDYNKAFDVHWLCRECHGFIHRVLRVIARPLQELAALPKREGEGT